MAKYLNKCESCECPFYGDYGAKRCPECNPYQRVEEPIPWGEREQTETAVYVIRCNESTFYKIGVSENPHVRLGSLQGGCPYKLTTIMEKWSINADRAHWIEQGLHRVFDERRVMGEWFKLSEDDLEKIGSILLQTKNMSNKELRDWFYGL